MGGGAAGRCEAGGRNYSRRPGQIGRSGRVRPRAQRSTGAFDDADARRRETKRGRGRERERERESSNSSSARRARRRAVTEHSAAPPRTHFIWGVLDRLARQVLAEVLGRRHDALRAAELERVVLVAEVSLGRGDLLHLELNCESGIERARRDHAREEGRGEFGRGATRRPRPGSGGGTRTLLSRRILYRRRARQHPCGDAGRDERSQQQRAAGHSRGGQEFSRRRVSSNKRTVGSEIEKREAFDS